MKMYEIGDDVAGFIREVEVDSVGLRNVTIKGEAFKRRSELASAFYDTWEEARVRLLKQAKKVERQRHAKWLEASERLERVSELPKSAPKRKR